MEKRGIVLVLLVFLLISTSSIVLGVDFTKYKSLEIFCDDDAGYCGVRTYCLGFMGGPGCNAEDGDCSDRFRSINSLPEQGCYIMASEDDDLE